MKESLRFTVIGLGGYGLVHIQAVQWLARLGLGRLVGVVALDVDRRARPELAHSLEAEGVRLYGSVEQFLQAGAETCDVLTVPVGIHQHVPVSIAGMEAGLHIYCEKPAAATVQEVDRLIEAQDRTGRLVAIGFQHIHSHSMRELKARICDGRLGRVNRLKLSCGWPRSVQYYSRNEWTGRLKINRNWILDSPANNAHAHYVMNALYLCSMQENGAGSPETVHAELYRGNSIEGPDTVQARVACGGGTDVQIVLTHANQSVNGPLMTLSCEKGNVYWQTDEGMTVVRYTDGRSERFDNRVHDSWRYEGFRDLVQSIRNQRQPRCNPAVARAQTLTINAIHESCPVVEAVPEEFVNEVEDWEMFPPNTRGRFRRIRDLDEYMHIAIAEGAMLSELGAEWATPGRSMVFRVGEYRMFPANADIQ